MSTFLFHSYLYQILNIMILLKTFLKEIILKEFDKSKLDFISRKLNISPDNEDYQKVMNALDSQGVKYPDLKQAIEKGEIKSFDDIKSLKTQSKTDNKKEVKSDAKKILDNANFLIIQPKTYEANCYYGSGTKWCTTQKGETGEQYFKDYTTNDNNYYIIIDKSKPSTDPLHKVGASAQFNISGSGPDENGEWKDFSGYKRTEFYDATDEKIDDEEYFNYLKSKGIDAKKLFGME